MSFLDSILAERVFDLNVTIHLLLVDILTSKYQQIHLQQ